MSKGRDFVSELWSQHQQSKRCVEAVKVLVLISHEEGGRRASLFQLANLKTSQGGVVPGLFANSDDIRMTHTYRRLRQETSGQFMLPSVTTRLEQCYAKQQLQRYEKMLVQTLLERFLPKVISEIIWSMTGSRDMQWSSSSEVSMPFVVEVIPPPQLRSLPRWLAECWSQVEYILVQNSRYGSMWHANLLHS